MVTVAGAVNAAGSALNSTGKAVSTLKAAARVEALAIKTAARAASRFDLAKPLATNKEMVKGIRELQAGLKGHLPGTALSATHTLTDFQRRALSENVRLVIGNHSCRQGGRRETGAREPAGESPFPVPRSGSRRESGVD